MPDNVATNGVTVSFAPDVFELEAMKRAAYSFSDRISVQITKDATGIRCFLQPLHSGSELDLQALEGLFRNEVLDQDLRIKIAAETEGYRNLILSLAFSKTPLSQK